MQQYIIHRQHTPSANNGCRNRRQIKGDISGLQTLTGIWDNGPCPPDNICLLFTIRVLHQIHNDAQNLLDVWPHIRVVTCGQLHFTCCARILRRQQRRWRTQHWLLSVMQCVTNCTNDCVRVCVSVYLVQERWWFRRNLNRIDFIHWFLLFDLVFGQNANEFRRVSICYIDYWMDQDWQQCGIWNQWRFFQFIEGCTDLQKVCNTIQRRIIYDIL